MKTLKQLCVYLTVLSSILIFTGCMATQSQLASPDQFSSLNIQPIEGTSGKYMSPITSDGVAAEWVDNAINAEMGATIGSTVGAMAGEQLVSSIPFIGGILGSEVGEMVGREAAIAAAGGEDFIKETSDLSFNSLDDMAVYLYATYGNNPNFNDVLSASFSIYPDFEQRYYSALYTANSQIVN
jgi:hypothetical protein